MLDEIRGIYYTLFTLKPSSKWLPLLLLIIVATTVFKISYSVVSLSLTAPQPVITIIAPIKDEATVNEEAITLVGNVMPIESMVKVNSDKIQVNEKGVFTKPIKLAEGSNRVKIEAAYLGKKSVANHTITYAKDNNGKDLAGNNEQVVAESEVLGKKLLSESEREELNKSMITEVREVRRGDMTVLVGKLQNKSDSTIGWIKVNASFFSNSGEVIDTQLAYITNIDQYLAPQANIPFEIPPTSTAYTKYELELEYDEIN